MPKHPSWSQRVTGHGTLAVLRLLSWLPFRLGLALGRALGRVAYYALSSRRRISARNIELCFPELPLAQQQQLVKSSFGKQGQALAETAYAWYKPVSFWRNRVEVIGLELLQHALDKQQPVLMTCAHFGSLDLYGAMMANFGRFDLVQRDLANPIINAKMRQARSRYGQPIGRKDSKGMIRALKANKVVFYAPDQDFGRKNSVFVDFFAIPTASLTATSRLAQLTGATVLFGFPHQTAKGYCMQIESAQPIPSNDLTADAQQYNHWLERRIRQVPDQYLWQHRRFKTRETAQEPSLY